LIYRWLKPTVIDLNNEGYEDTILKFIVL